MGRAPFPHGFPDLSRRLDGDGPLGVAVSGGGDSVALLYMLAEWGQRPLHVFCVDHGLNPDSAAWTASVGAHAKRVGADFTPLHWTGDKPSTGLAAAARRARHGLLATAARQSGISVLCLAHTADDIAEARLMRAQGSNVGAPQAWSPSPVWPDGHGVFLYRPLLDVRREALRGYLRDAGVNWIDDPANDNPASLRARVRAGLRGGAAAEAAPVPFATDLPDLPDFIDTQWADYGLISLRADVMHALPSNAAFRVLSAAVVCAGGGDKLPRRAELENLLARLPAGGVMTLCGSRIEPAADLIHITRNPGDIERRPAAVSDQVWDGRFVVPGHDLADIRPVCRVRGDLSAMDRDVLAALPAIVRGHLPVLKKENESKLLSAYNVSGLNCLVMPRFFAALGMIETESAVAWAFGGAFGSNSWPSPCNSWPGPGKRM
ncbi:tRNA lysidine(34) synthetase TilS [Asticcacaulis sp. 201]|uniref:tRNA lysidine(34) synthetase TilS n=1 Tax=Asticcacaulis sp. 201 TaxID=3028787 RepID=UPI002916F472|nr:tRNA lysidine(34) synthetase TilS [Asticcacaulis sp. 201]MDV6332516.1 tRNA lysidine(34) synthetase TilS [Asticcacaulis sp. 201]